jgi:hypothetical protein
MLVAIDTVRNASTSRPVGMSNVRIVESREDATSHLESGEKHWLASANASNNQLSYVPRPVFDL